MPQVPQEVQPATFYGTADNDIVFQNNFTFDYYGLGGDDVFFVDANDAIGPAGYYAYPDQYFFGGSGSDTMSYVLSDKAILANLGTGIAYRMFNGQAQSTHYLSSIENLTGSNFADTIYGSDGANLLRGGGGGDTIYGLDGDDHLWGDSGNDTVDGGEGDDTVDGGTGNDVLSGRRRRRHRDRRRRCRLPRGRRAERRAQWRRPQRHDARGLRRRPARGRLRERHDGRRKRHRYRRLHGRRRGHGEPVHRHGVGGLGLRHPDQHRAGRDRQRKRHRVRHHRQQPARRRWRQ